MQRSVDSPGHHGYEKLQDYINTLKMDKAKVYRTKNNWQNNRYAFMLEFTRKNGITEFGHAPGGNTRYYHLLTEKDKQMNFLDDKIILEAVLERFKKKAGDLQRALTNTVASQPCCFNLFVPLQKNKETASGVFSALLQKAIKVDEIIVEFTPDPKESLGDQSERAGTDSDVAVFYTAQGKKGVILIEFKYIEDGFSRCMTYRNNTKKEGSEDIRGICDNAGFFDKLKNQRRCGYMKYNNWTLTENSEAFDYDKIMNNRSCPFRFSLQQLWRNLLLAENVKNTRNLDEFHFWAISPAENKALWKDGGEDVCSAFRSILTPSGNKAFRRIHLQEFFRIAKNKTADDWYNECMKRFEQKYLTGTNLS